MEQRQEILSSLSDAELEALLHTWGFWARSNQLEPAGFWEIWLILAGRGFGKTRTGAETVRGRVEANKAGRIALIAPTAADARDVMVEGESGILAVSPKWFRPIYEPSKRRLTWPNGAVATTYSADEPERLRGPQHDFAWFDEFCAWRYIQEAYDMAMFGLRLGDNPQAVVTTTPKPVAMLRQLRRQPGTITTNGSTYDNALNLAKSFVNNIIKKYENTRLGQQEILGIELNDTPGALWNAARLEILRLRFVDLPAIKKIVVGVDPNGGGEGENAAETGIIVGARGINDHFIALDDYSTDGTPEQWASAVVKACKDYKTNDVIVEVNHGGLMCVSVLRAHPEGKTLNIRMVRASTGKQARAEPVSMLYEQGRGNHLGNLGMLESQMTTWVPNSGMKSPDRLDALVWACAGLFEDIFEEATKRPGSIKRRNYLNQEED